MKEPKYQTWQMDNLVNDLNYSGIFSQEFKDMIMRVWASRNIEEMKNDLKRVLKHLIL